ncbi:hypothetical protein AAIM60_25820 [Pseudomonas lijiangensis]|uniref:hypothetical protein n=1 Tax=Pseudomonas syringae group TaxID=136849 RepID=UPI0018E64128|nr:hypothetical protein [Pseudomonas cichorii]MBI6856041.1 hypothetical protein [Pseudomonas cichorii]
MMAGYLIYPSDLTELGNYMQVLRKLPEFTRSFKVNLDLVPVREYGAYRIPEIETLLAKAAEHFSIGSKTLSAINALHGELVMFIEDITQSAASVTNSKDVTLHFIERSQKGLSAFLDALDKHLETLKLMTQGIYTILPRIIDFLNSNIYRHAYTYNLIEKNPDQNSALQSLTSSFSFAENGPALSPIARLRGARNYVQITQRQYAESYGAIANMNAHVTRVSNLLAISLGRSLNMRRTNVASRPYMELQLMLVCLREIQRLSQWFNTPTDKPA